MFVPKEFQTLLACIEAIFQASEPELFSSVITTEKERTGLETMQRLHKGKTAAFVTVSNTHKSYVEPPKFSGEDWLRLIKLQKLAEQGQTARGVAAGRLHQALGDGDLIASLLVSSGTILPVPLEAWRAWGASRAFSFGWLKLPGWPPIEGNVLVSKGAFSAWLMPPDHSETVTHATVLAWMTKRQAETVAQRGAPLKRDVLAADASQECGVTVRAARALFTQLPTHLRNPARRNGDCGS